MSSYHSNKILHCKRNNNKKDMHILIKQAIICNKYLYGQNLESVLLKINSTQCQHQEGLNVKGLNFGVSEHGCVSFSCNKGNYMTSGLSGDLSVFRVYFRDFKVSLWS